MPNSTNRNFREFPGKTPELEFTKPGFSWKSRGKSRNWNFRIPDNPGFAAANPITSLIWEKTVAFVETTIRLKAVVLRRISLKRIPFKGSGREGTEFDKLRESGFPDFLGKAGKNPETGILKVRLFLKKPGKSRGKARNETYSGETS